MAGVQVARLGDQCSGHGCWPPRPNVQGSPNVFVNGKAVHRETDAWDSHCCPLIPECHASVLSSGSSKTFANGLQIGRVGDPVACGSTVAEGSTNTYDGG